MSQTSDLLNYYAQIDLMTKEVISEFQKSIHKNRFFNNKEYLYTNSKYIAFDKGTWHLRPEFFSLDYYGIPELFRVILLLNNISTRFNFRESNFKIGIITPTIESIRTVLSQNI